MMQPNAGNVRISFAPAMVRALIDGTKTQSRRFATGVDRRGFEADALWFSVPIGSELLVREPAYREAEQVDPVTGAKLVERICYRADGDAVGAPCYRFTHGRDAGRWSPDVLTRAALDLPNGSIAWAHPRFLPVWATRLVLILQDVRRERLLDMTDAGAMAEGATQRAAGWAVDWSGVGRMSARLGRPVTEADIARPTPRAAFFAYWSYLHSPKGDRSVSVKINTNPDLAVLSFAVERATHPCWGVPA